MSYIDLNSDVGESFGIWRMGDDEQIFSSVSSANVACGFHAGDPSTIRSTCRKAVEAHIAIGAHVSYRDLAGFGRRFLDCSASELIDDIIYQMGALQALAATVGGTIRYVKPHGALYNAIVDHEVHAQAVVQAISSFDDSLPLLGLPGSLALRKAEAAGIRPVAEAFADRNYTPQGTLVSRREPDAVIHDRARAAENMIRLASEGKIVAVDGSLITMPTESICLHSDTPGAVAMAAAVRTGLERAGLSIRSFV